MFHRNIFTFIVAAIWCNLLLLPLPSPAQAPSPVGPVPNAKQIEWYHREVMVFLHFNMNTFTGNEWGEGTDAPDLFHPTDLDCDQWVKSIRNAGFTCAILTAKHHDGFCLWPSAYTDYDITASSWKNGGGDVVKEFCDACNNYGVKPGLYLSPWDRHEPSYGTPAYNTFYANQLKELLSNYGPIYEIWWDGAGNQMAFDFARWADTIKAVQADCFIFGAKKASPYVDGRWIGNEDGVADDPCWATIDRSVIDREEVSVLASGQENGTSFVPAECDVSIRPGWYFHSNENYKVKSVATLWNTIYFGSVGRNCVLLLNLPPDKRGLIHQTDSTRIDSLGGWIRGTFAENLAADATVSALHGRGWEFAPVYMVDTSENTFYAGTDNFTTDTLEFDLHGETVFDCALIQEKIEVGHRITRWHFEAYHNGKWNDVSGSRQSIGYKRLLKFNELTASKVRLRITEGKACPAIHTFGIYKSAFAHPPVVKASRPVSRSGGHTTLSYRLTIAGNKLLLPEAFMRKRGSISLYDLQGRSILKRTIVGKSTASYLPEDITLRQALVVIYRTEDECEQKIVIVGGNE